MASSGILAFAAAHGPVLSLAGGAPVPRSSGAHGLDKTLFLDVNQFARDTGWLHTPMYDYASYGVALFAALLIAGWWVARRRGPAAMAAALWAGAGTLLAVAVAQPVNHAVAEARPWESVPHALILAGHSTDFSFPSDHGVMAGAVMAGLLLYDRRLGIVAAVAGVVLCFARVYIGAHYPQDVAGGLVLGAAVVLLGYVIVRVPLSALVRLLSGTPLRPLLTAAPGPVRAPGHRAPQHAAGAGQAGAGQAGAGQAGMGQAGTGQAAARRDPPR